MAIKGSEAKTEIMNKLLETFPNSFLYNDGKELRINYMENGELVQIKVTLTAAKTPVENETTDSISMIYTGGSLGSDQTSEKIPEPPSAEEQARLAAILKKLNL